MKKILFILLFFCSFAQAQIPVGTIAKTSFISHKVARFRDSLLLFSGSPNLYADTNKYFATMEFQRGLLRANLDTCFYMQWLMLYVQNNSSAVVKEYAWNVGSTSVVGNLVNVGSPTVNGNGIVYNGTTQYSYINYINGGDKLNPRLLLENIYGKNSTDTVANTNMNIDIFNKNVSDFPIFFSGVNDGSALFKSISISTDASNVYFRSYDNNALKITAYTGNRNGLFSLNRIDKKQYFYIRGGVIDSLISSTYDFSIARQIGGTGFSGTDPAFYLQAIPWAATYFSGTLQYAAIRKRGFTPTEMTTYNNLVTVLQQRLGRY